MLFSVDSLNEAKPDKRIERWAFILHEHARKHNDAANYP